MGFKTLMANGSIKQGVAPSVDLSLATGILALAHGGTATTTPYLVLKGGSIADVTGFVVAETIVASATIVIAAGDTIRFEFFGSINNAVGSNRTYTLGLGVSGTAGTSVTGSAVVASGTDTPVHMIGYMGIRSTSLVYSSAVGSFNPVGTAGTSVTPIVRNSWNTQAVDITGSQVCSIVVHSDGAGAGSTLHVAGYSIQRINL